MRRVLFTLTVLALALPSAAAAAPGRPTPTSPANGAVTPWVPALGWKPVAGADHYIFQMAADAGFNSPVEVSGDSVLETRNTFATWKVAIPNGNYWWHVRAVDAKGNPGPWSAAWRFNKKWVGLTTPLQPLNNSTLSYPKNPTMRWQPVDGAAKYEFTIASDSDLSSMDGKPAKAVETDSNEFTYVAGLTAGTTYYWSVTPIDGEGNRGVPSAPFAFTWQWNSTSTLSWTDLAPAPDVVDPRFSWTPIPNAARYDVEINSDASFAAGSKFCCTSYTVGTVLTPTTVLLNNQYYWRVRAVDADGNFGQWNYYDDGFGNPFFTKTFDTRPFGDPNPSIQHLRMADNISGVADPLASGSDADPVADGYQTAVPIVTWDPVLGASAYEVEVRWFTGGGCTAGVNSEYWDDIVATNAWTPLGPRPDDEPWPNHGRNLAHDGSRDLVPGHSYCVRVRAFTDQGYNQNHILTNVVGDWSYLDNGNDPNGVDPVSFGFTGYPDDVSCTDNNPTPTDCGALDATAADYTGAPLFGETTDHTPVFTWQPTTRAQGYFVLVSRDPNFTTVVDYAWTREPAYAPRFGTSATSYADETTAYYWVVMPAALPDGVNVRTDPSHQFAGQALPPDFTKESNVPNLNAPIGGAATVVRPTFEWSMVDWARTYTLQVASDPTFSNLVETVTTASTSYTPQGNYPPGLLWWRVRVNDWNHIALTWSPSETFSVTLSKPVGAGTNVTAGQLPPTWAWSPVPGAISYDIEIQYPNGNKKLFKGYRTSAVTLVKLDGSGLWHWKVRANFPTKNPTTNVQGGWSTSYSFRNSMPAPGGTATSTVNGGLLFSWLPRVGAAHYQVEVSQRPDFGGTMLERLKVDSPVYAPVLTSPQYVKGGNLYWRVAMVDETGNVGEMSPGRGIYLPQQLKVTALGALKRKKSGRLVITVLDPKRNGVAGAKVVITGAGLRRKTVKTNSQGKVTVKLKPTKKGSVKIAVSKTGKPAFRSTSITITVR